jgi:hypothetical protein
MDRKYGIYILSYEPEFILVTGQNTTPHITSKGLLEGQLLVLDIKYEWIMV